MNEIKIDRAFLDRLFALISAFVSLEHPRNAITQQELLAGVVPPGYEPQMLEGIERCRVCGCNEHVACEIPLRKRKDDDVRDK